MTKGDKKPKPKPKFTGNVWVKNNYHKKNMLYYTETTKEEMKNGQYQITQKIHKSDQSLMGVRNIHEVNKAIRELKKDSKYVVRVVSHNAGTFFTLKSYNGELNFKTYEDYMAGTLKDFDKANYHDDFYTMFITYLK